MHLVKFDQNLPSNYQIDGITLISDLTKSFI